MAELDKKNKAAKKAKDQAKKNAADGKEKTSKETKEPENDIKDEYVIFLECRIEIMPFVLSGNTFLILMMEAVPMQMPMKPKKPLTLWNLPSNQRPA